MHLYPVQHALRERIAARLFRAHRDAPTIPLGFPPHLRYLRPIADGAAGEVHLASDPTLDRPVAVKLLRARSGPNDLRRLLREARTLARLAHPNVVHVYEVGESDGRLFLVMEFVNGASLLERQRGSEQPLGFAEIVLAYLEAAQGLAAAHEAGIVHRDVKPANILLGDDGRVRVADFGLARPLDDSTDPAESELPASSDLSSRLDAIVGPLPRLATESRDARGGTPAYMAPETVRAGIADAQSDQYSWGVSFYEAIYGARPAAALSVPARTPSGNAVPRYVRDVLYQALALEPAQRATSLTTLIDILRNGPQRVRRRRSASAALGFVVAASATAYAVARSTSGCPSAEGMLDGTWDRESAARVASAFEGSNLPSAETAAFFAIAALDDYAVSWTAARVEACEATRTRSERSDELLDLTNACLDARRVQLESLARLLATGSPDVIGSVADLVTTLEPVAICSNPAALEEARESAFDPSLAERFVEIRDRLARARLAFARGLHPEALRLVEHALADAHSSAAPLVVAEALLAVGEFRRAMGDGASASAVLVDALDAAETANAPALKSDILIALALTHADLTEQLDQSSYHLDRARATLQRLGIDAEQHPAWLDARAARDEASGDLDGSEETLRTLLQHHRNTDATVETATTLARLGRVLEATRPAEARAAYEEAIDLLSASLGPRHLRTVGVVFNLGLLAQAQGLLDEAQDAFDLMLKTTSDSLGPDAARLATVHNAIADLANHRDDPRRALAHGTRALAIQASLPFAEPSVVAASHTAVANSYRLLGDNDLALEHALAALQLQETRLNDVELAEIRINVGEFLCLADRCAEARPHYVAAAEATRFAGDSRGRTMLAYAMNGLGKVALSARAHAEAVASYLVAAEIASGDLGGSDVLLTAETQWGLAQARLGLGAPREAASHAAIAIEACEAAGLEVVERRHDEGFSPSPCKGTPQPP